MNKGALLLGGGILAVGAFIALSASAKDEPAQPSGGGPAPDPNAQARCDSYFAAKAILRNQRENAKASLVDIDAALMAAYINEADPAEVTQLENAKKGVLNTIKGFDSELAKLDAKIEAEGC